MASKTAPKQPISAIMFQRKTEALKGVMGLMAHCSTLMGQLLQLMPRHVFDHLSWFPVFVDVAPYAKAPLLPFGVGS